MKKIPIFFLAFVVMLAMASTAGAHLPYLERDKAEIAVRDPEISKAYYGWLAGRPAVYSITSAKPFLLYLNLLSPQIENGRTDYAAKVYKDGDLFADVGADNSLWLVTYEPFANDYYAKGPEYEARVPAGDYKIEVYNSGDSGNYVLAVGNAEDLSLGQFLRTLAVMPGVKQEFFGLAWWEAFNSLIGLAAFVLLVIFAATVYLIVFFVKRWRLKKQLDIAYAGHKNNR